MAVNNAQARWALLAGFLSQNVAIGLTFGAFGLLVGELGQAFSASRSVSSFGIAIVTLLMGIVSPLVGLLLDRWSIKWVMVSGCLFGAAGFWLAAQATGIGMFLLSYGVLVGIAVACTANLPVTKLASNWFAEKPGKAIGFVNLPLLIAIGPPAFGYIMADTGWRGLLTGFAVVYLLLAIPLLFLRDAPTETSSALTGAAEPDVESSPEPWLATLADRRLWVMVLVAGVLFSGGIVLITHIVEHATGQGVPLVKASLLVSLNGAFAVVGAMAFGWVSDIYSPRYAVTGNALAQVILWPLLTIQSSFYGMAIVVALISVCSGGAFPAISAFARETFGASRVGVILGQVMLLVVPFNFGAAPLAGYFFDVFGGYAPAMILQAVLCIMAATLMTLGWRWSFGAVRAT